MRSVLRRAVHRPRAAAAGDTTPPAATGAAFSTDGLSFIVSFDEIVFTTGADGGTGFAITTSGSLQPTLGVPTGSGTNELTYALSRRVYDEETATYVFTAPADGIADAAGNKLASITSTAVTNNSTENPIAVDMHYTGEGTDGAALDATNMAAQAKTSDGGTLSITSGAGQATFSAGGLITMFPRAVKANGVIYFGNAPNKFRIDNGSSSTTFACRKLVTARDEFFASFYLQCGPATDFDYSDIFQLENASGLNHCTAQWRTNTTPAIHIHSAAGTVSATNAVKNQLYYIQVRSTRNSATGAAIAVWSVAGDVYTYLGTNTLAMTDVQLSRVYFPVLNPHGETSPGPTDNPYYDVQGLNLIWTSPPADVTELLWAA